MEQGMTVSLVAREAGITTSQLFQWRKAYTEGSLVAVGEARVDDRVGHIGADMLDHLPQLAGQRFPVTHDVP